jgi:perosamine synthetase
MIPVFKPSIGKEELDAIKAIFKTGWIGLGPKTAEFEEKFAKYTGTKHAVALNSCTSALHLAMKVMDIEGGEVITTPMTFISTNHAILYNNATPVFADIEEDTLNIDPSDIERKITKRTKAIVVVHYGGHACDMDRIMAIAKKHGLKVIEDCAHGCGGEHKGRKLGSIGDIACFSFHAVKNLATGEGGMITLNDAKLAERLKRLRWLGISRDTFSRNLPNKGYSWYYNVEEVGYKYHMNDIPAVIGIVQLKKLDKTNGKRGKLYLNYNKQLSKIKDIEIPVIKPYASNAYHNYVIKARSRDALIEYLKEKGISTGVHYIPNHLYDIYKDFRVSLPVAEKVWKKLVTLPLFPDLTASEQAKVINSIKSFYK